MSWTSTFIEHLSAPPAPVVFAFRTIQIADELTYRGDYIAATDPRFGDAVLMGPPGHTGASLSLENFTATVGGWSFEMCGDLDQLRTYVTRGTCVEVLMGFGGYAVDDLQRIGLGRVDNIRFNGRTVTLSVLDPTSLLDGRWVAAGDEGDLFWDLRSGSRTATTLTADYTAGDTSLTVTSSANFARETGGTGALLIGDHILTYTGTGAGTFTGCSTVGRFLTTAADVATGESVTECAYLYGNPLGIARKVLMSTGDGTNGAWDQYPASWGFGLPAGMVDTDDIADEASLIVTVDPAAYKLELLITEPQTDARGWITGWLSKAGCYVAMRQGLLTVRGLSGDPTRHREVVAAFTDASWESGSLQSEWWDSGRPKEYGTTDVYYGTATLPIPSAVQQLHTLPGGVDKPIDLSSMLFNEDGYADQGDVITEIHDRVFMFAKSIGEVITGTTGLGAMVLTVGDHVTFRSTCPYLRFGYDRTDYDVEVLVVQVSPDFARGTCTVRMVSQYNLLMGES